MITKVKKQTKQFFNVILERNTYNYDGNPGTLNTFTLGKHYQVQEHSTNYYTVTSDVGSTVKIGKHYFGKPLNSAYAESLGSFETRDDWAIKNLYEERV